MAKEKGIIKRVKPILNELKRHNFFMSKNIYAEIVKLSGEI
jgi:predicted nucleic acid-binding protein